MAKKRSKKDTAEETPSFETALEQLEQVVRRLESPDLNLDEALEQYENGVRYLKLCRLTLREAETKIEMLTRVDADGRSTSVPFDEDAGSQHQSLQEKQDDRSRRRGVPKQSPEQGEQADPDEQKNARDDGSLF